MLRRDLLVFFLGTAIETNSSVGGSKESRAFYTKTGSPARLLESLGLPLERRQDVERIAPCDRSVWRGIGRFADCNCSTGRLLARYPRIRIHGDGQLLRYGLADVNRLTYE